MDTSKPRSKGRRTSKLFVKDVKERLFEKSALSSYFFDLTGFRPNYISLRTTNKGLRTAVIGMDSAAIATLAMSKARQNRKEKFDVAYFGGSQRDHAKRRSIGSGKTIAASKPLSNIDGNELLSEHSQCEHRMENHDGRPADDTADVRLDRTARKEEIGAVILYPEMMAAKNTSTESDEGVVFKTQTATRSLFKSATPVEENVVAVKDMGIMDACAHIEKGKGMETLDLVETKQCNDAHEDENGNHPDCEERSNDPERNGNGGWGRVVLRPWKWPFARQLVCTAVVSTLAIFRKRRVE